MSEQSTGCYFVDSPWGWKEKLRYRLFPIRFAEMPDVPGMKDCMITRTTCVLSFADRLRVLVSGRLEVETKTATENLIGNHATGGTCYPLPPQRLAADYVRSFKRTPKETPDAG